MIGNDEFLKNRKRLLDLLLKDGICFGTPEKPVLSGTGTSHRWMLDTLGFSLTTEGITLAGRCLLKLLESFSGGTLATYGTIGIPLLTSCVQQSNGRFEGLLVRKEVKTYGSRKRFEGRIDKNKPVIIIDDSINSGNTMRTCKKLLEDEGFRVEGCVCLVRFGWDTGFGRLAEQGVHMESLFDIWEDVMANMDKEPCPEYNPTLRRPKYQEHENALPDGLHPAVAVRMAMEEYLRSGLLLKPPQCLDRDYDGDGGLWVSVRPKSNIYLRHARDGMWHFPGEPHGPVTKDLMLAIMKTAYSLNRKKDAFKLLENSAIAVTFFSAMEECSVGDLDNNRYGIVVKSNQRPGIMGGALPNMPGISNEWMQFQHARKKNGRLTPREDFTLLRHELEKVVEPGIQWQPTGAGRSQRHPLERTEIAGNVTQWALNRVQSLLNISSDAPPPALPDEFLKNPPDTLFVTLYLDGMLRGCSGLKVDDPEETLRTLCQSAIIDERFDDQFPADFVPEDVGVSVSFLTHPLEIGQFSAKDVMNRVQLGEQALMAYQGQRNGFMLPFTVTYFNLSHIGYPLEVIDKAGITRPPYFWKRFDCRSWLAVPDCEPRMLTGMFPNEQPPQNTAEALPDYANLTADYLLNHQLENGSLYFRYFPFKDSLEEKTDLLRMSHACWIMARGANQLEKPELQTGALNLFQFVMSRLSRQALNATSETSPDKSPEKPSEKSAEESSEKSRDISSGIEQLWLQDASAPSTVAEISFLLLAILNLPQEEKSKHITVAKDIARFLWSRIDEHGKITVFQDPKLEKEAFQDYAPGQLLLALAVACRDGVSQCDETKLACAFDYYRHRFRYKRDFGQVSWLMQAFASWFPVTGEEAHYRFVFEIGDWIRGYQVQEGCFLNDHQPLTPGYTTALYLEGLSAASGLAEETGDSVIAKKYREACLSGFRFMDRLIIQERDCAILPNPGWAVGGVRSALHQSEVRIDFVQHTLAALLEFMPMKSSKIKQNQIKTNKNN